jgi:hypothetical protein
MHAFPFAHTTSDTRDMRRASPCWLLLCVTACKGPEEGGLSTGYTVGVETSTGTTENSEATETATETGTDTEDNPPGDPLRFIAAGESMILAFDLSDPDGVPPPETVASGTGIAELFGPTPFGTEAVVHDGVLDQLSLSDDNVLSLSSLVFQDGNWLPDLFFGPDGRTALITTAVDALANPNVMLWARYTTAGVVTGSYDITPPKNDTGAVRVLDRSPDGTWAAVAVNVQLQPTDGWDFYLLDTDPDPGETYHVDYLDLAGLPHSTIGNYISMHLDDERIVYRRQVLPMVYRPVAVGFNIPDGVPVDLGPNLPTTYAITPADTCSRLLVTTEGEPGYRELRLLELDGPTSALDPLTITLPEELAVENNPQPLMGPPIFGHAFDALGRILFVYADGMDPAENIGIALVTASNGVIEERLELIELINTTYIDAVAFDEKNQLLGFRVYSSNSSWIHYIDLKADQPVSIRLDADFEHYDTEPQNYANFGWSADGTHIVAVGVQNGQTFAHVAEIGDASGDTVEIELPDVEATPGYTIEHRPNVSPLGDHIMVWYSTQAGRRGLIHAPTDGSVPGVVVLTPQHTLTSSTYLPHISP